MLTYFYQISTHRMAWLLLMLSAVAFELCALFFQYVMNLPPCVMCIYERVAMLGVAVAGGLGFIAPQTRLIRWPAILLWIASSAKGLQLAIEHVGYQFPDPNDLFGQGCDIFVRFPEWAPLNKWAPWAFEPEPTGNCGKIVWQFLTLSMPQWLVVIFGAMLLMAFIVTLSQIFAKKTSKA